MQDEAAIRAVWLRCALENAHPLVFRILVDKNNPLKTKSYTVSVPIQAMASIMDATLAKRPEYTVKAARRCYVGTAVIGVLFLMETFLPIQLF